MNGGYKKGTSLFGRKDTLSKAKCISVMFGVIDGDKHLWLQK